jgi:hypothetical protein
MYNQYYSAADCTVYVSKNSGEQILLDKLAGIMISEELSSYPIYGLGNSYFGFTTRGNYVVNGLLDINFIHASYLTNAIKSLDINKVQIAQAAKAEKKLGSKKDYFSMTADEIKGLKTQLNSFDKPIGTSEGIAYLKSGFDITIVFDNSSNLRDDVLSSFIVIKNCRIIASDITASVAEDQQIIRRYRFIGQIIYEQS